MESHMLLPKFFKRYQSQKIKRQNMSLNISKIALVMTNHFYDPIQQEFF